MNIKKFINKQRKIYDKHKNIVTKKRDEWDEFSRRALDFFKNVKYEAEKNGFNNILDFGDNSRFPKQKRKNLNYIFFKFNSYFIDIEKKEKQIEEKGSQLIIYQSLKGDVFIFFYPNESELYIREDETLLIRHFSYPKNISNYKLFKIIKLFFWYNLINSYFGKINIIDKNKLWRLKTKGMIFKILFNKILKPIFNKILSKII